MNPYVADREARRILADALESEAAEHDAGRYSKLAECYDDVYGELLPLVNTDRPPFQVALYFLDSWGDASQHQWRFYDGINQADWPTYARQIASVLRSDGQVTDPILLRHFGPRRPSFVTRWFQRMVGLLRPSA
jgi:hypothetical protein